MTKRIATSLRLCYKSTDLILLAMLLYCLLKKTIPGELVATVSLKAIQEAKQGSHGTYGSHQTREPKTTQAHQ